MNYKLHEHQFYFEFYWACNTYIYYELEAPHFEKAGNKEMQPPRIENQIYSSQVNCFTNQASSVMIITKQYFMSLLMILSFDRILYS